jgi:hypothetical protein
MDPQAMAALVEAARMAEGSGADWVWPVVVGTMLASTFLATPLGIAVRWVWGRFEATEARLNKADERAQACEARDAECQRALAEVRQEVRWMRHDLLQRGGSVPDAGE